MTGSSDPTRLDTDLALATSRIGQTLWHYRSLPSTMPLAHELARAGAADGTAIVADEQTAGRGRRGRTWVAPPGTAVLCSVICRPPLLPNDLFLLVAAFGLGISDGIERATALRPQIKWPNDLLLNGRKIAGLLCESRLGTKGLDHAIVGFGLNVNLTRDDLPPTTGSALPPTSLAIALGSAIDRDEILRAALQGIDAAYDRLWRGEADVVREEWAVRLFGMGELVAIETDDGRHEGEFVGVDPDGALLLRHTGQLERFLVGDVVLGPRPVAKEQDLTTA